MDVEQIQKINSLALDLLRQGLAQSRDEAVEQAEKIYKSRDVSDFQSLRDTVKSQGVDSLTPRAAAVVSNAGGELGGDKIREILEQNTSFVVKKFKEFQEKIIQLEGEMNTLKVSMGNMRVNMPRPAEQQPIAREMPKTEAAGNHPRSGNYKEADVSIEKFFYMGHK